MNIEETIRLWIYIHAALGGIALLAGMIALIAKKGMRIHKQSGRVFYFSMLGSVIISLGASLAPNHHHPFLFPIGVFSLYSLVGGKRSLSYRDSDTNLTFDYAFAIVMLVVGALMIYAGFFLYEGTSLILIIFGVLGLQRAITDLIIYRKKEKLKAKWLQMHISKMTGGYIACLSAFLVVNNTFPNYVNWLGPGLIGSFYIAYWIRKVNKKKVVTV